MKATFLFYILSICGLAANAEEGSINPIRFNFNKVEVIAEKASFDSIPSSSNPTPQVKNKLLTGQGYLTYVGNYRSQIDTPFAQQDLWQQQLVASSSITVASFLPLQVTAIVRKSNSPYLRDRAEVQVSLDPSALQALIYQRLKSKIQATPLLKTDTSLLQKWMDVLKQKNAIDSWLNSPSNIQKVAESHELLQNPALLFNPKLSDSLNQLRRDSFQRQANEFLQYYEQQKVLLTKWNQKKDSLQKLKDSADRIVEAFRQILQGQVSGLTSVAGSQVADSLENHIPARYRWLLHLKQFSLGKYPLNSSTLTAQNVSLNGLQVAYNSWYYFSAAVGNIDYRFRDFYKAQGNDPRQFIYLLRLGVGKIEKNYLIATLLQGKKQLTYYTSTSDRNSVISIRTYSLEGKWRFSATGYVLAEAAWSHSPNFQEVPVNKEPVYAFSDHSNKALALKGSWSNRAHRTRFDGYYKFTGANFQSFHSMQTNAQVRSWNIKGDQQIFKGALRVAGSLNQNDFTYPSIAQGYTSNSVMKSLTASFRRRHWPIVTVSYLPISQLTMVESQVTEQRFQSFTGSLTHFYKLINPQASTSLVFSRFYNEAVDSNFLYFNSRHIFLSQSILFKGFTLGLQYTYSYSAGNRYEVMEESVAFPIASNGSLGGGLRIHQSMDKSVLLGGYLEAGIGVGKGGHMDVRMEKVYLPNNKGTMLPNSMGSLTFSKYFSY
jgi:hypothetical protein